jgi:hypothetical protein
MVNEVVRLKKFSEHRVERRKMIDKYYSVQFSLKQKVPIYQFKLKDISSDGLCIIVKENSKILETINKNDVLEMTFCAANAPEVSTQYKTKIIHITPDKSGKYKNHYLVGFSIMDDKSGSIKQV